MLKGCEFCEREPLPKTVWLFPGQGVQYVGMGKSLYDKEPAIKRIYNQADAILEYPLSQISFEGPQDLLNQTRYTQPATFLCNFANAFLAKMEGHADFIPPVFVAGHSFGEYNALVEAGALSFMDGLILVDQRAQVTQKVADETPGGMVVVKAEKDNQILQEALARFDLDLALVNALNQVVIGGLKQKLAEAMDFLRKHNLKIIPLNISGAFHTRLMQPSVNLFQEVLDQVEIKAAQIPIIANTTAQPIKTPDEIKKELLDQLTHTVCWLETIKYFARLGITRMIEFGEKEVLTSFNKNLLGGQIYRPNTARGSAVIWSSS